MALSQASTTFEPCPECAVKLGTRDFKYCDPCSELRDAAVARAMEHVKPLCSNCEQRPPYDEAETLCAQCRDAHDQDDGAKRRRMTSEERERATDDKLTNEVMPPLPPDLHEPEAPKPVAKSKAARRAPKKTIKNKRRVTR